MLDNERITTALLLALDRYMSQSKIKRAKTIYREEGFTSLIKSAYRAYAPSPLVFSYSSFNYGPKRTLTEPNIFRGHIRMKLLKQINNQIGKRIYTDKGESVMEKDWDNLIILDACRYDTFEDNITLEGDLSEIYSLAPETSRFLERTFNGDQFHDTVYVSGNAKVSKELPSDTFHAVVPSWQDGWDDEVGSILPSVVTADAIEASKNHPNKRLIVHYTQPHMPLVGDNGREFMKENNLYAKRSHPNGPRISDAFRYGLVDVSDEVLYELYEENLKQALDSVEILVDELNGKTVISSDHGELLGHRVGVLPMKGYMHPTPLHVGDLLRVPWFELPFDDRKDIKTETPNDIVDVDMGVAESRLEDLGYVM